MSGSLSLIIVLIVVVWAIVLAPMILGDSKPIRRAGEGYDETRVLHQGGTAALQARRRPRVTAADVHRHEEEDDYEVVVPEAESTEAVLVDDFSAGSTSWKKLFSRSAVIEAEAEPGEETTEEAEAETEAAEESGSTKLDLDNEAEYDYDDSYLAPEDFGYNTVVPMEDTEAEAETDTEADTDTDTEADTEAAAEDVDEATLARAARGRGGWSPEAEKRARAERLRRRERTLLGLITLTGIAFIFALVSGGWAWLAPVLSGGLLVWYMSALRSLVRQERALHERRIRQLRRARLGVVSSDEKAPVPAHMRRPGAVILELDDESADFANLPESHFDEIEETYEPIRIRESA